MYSRYIKYIIYGTPYFLVILHFHCILVWPFCNSCVRSFLHMVLMNVFYFFRICQVSWISFVFRSVINNMFGYPYARSFITYEYLHRSIALSILCWELERLRRPLCSKWACHGLFKDCNCWKRPSEIKNKVFKGCGETLFNVFQTSFSLSGVLSRLNRNVAVYVEQELNLNLNYSNIHLIIYLTLP